MIHTLTELCYDLCISKGARSKFVRRISDSLGVVGKSNFVSGHTRKVLTYTNKQYKYVLTEYPKLQKIEQKKVAGYFAKAAEPSKNRKLGYYMTIQEHDMLNAFQGRAV